jgi:predicted permease
MLSQGSYIMSVMLSNVGTLGGVCAFILYSDVGFAYSQIIASCQNFLLVVLCFPLAQYYYNRHISAFSTDLKKTSILKKFISWNQISVVGICIGLYLNAKGVQRSDFLTSFFHFMVHFGAWVALVPVGYLINFSKIRHYYWKVFDIVVVRFLIVPTAIYLTGCIFFTDRVLLNSLLICAMAPTAINAVLTAKLYKLNVNLPAASFVSTTALFLLVIFPILFFVIK